MSNINCYNRVRPVSAAARYRIMIEQSQKAQQVDGRIEVVDMKERLEYYGTSSSSTKSNSMVIRVEDSQM